MPWQTFDSDDVDIDGRLSNGNFPNSDSYYPGVDPRPDHEYGIHDSYKYQFDSEEELVKSKFFQDALNKALAHKDLEILQLRQELLKYWPYFVKGVV